MKIMAVLLLIIAIFLSGCVEEETQNQYVFTEADNGRTVSFENGTIFYLNLSENPSTGYSWEIELSPGLTLINSTYSEKQVSEDAKPLLGASGLRTWKIKADSKGNKQIKGIYKRSWEEETGTEDNFTLNLEVT
jgi:inhibitor of cysteine peptidase